MQKICYFIIHLVSKGLDSGCNALNTKLIASYGSHWEDMIIEVDQMDYDRLKCFSICVANHTVITGSRVPFVHVINGSF